MSLNSLINWFKPHEMVFFDLLEASAGNLLDSAKHFEAEFKSRQTPGEWAGMRFGGHEVCKRPGIFGGNRTIWAGRQTTLYLTVRR